MFQLHFYELLDVTKSPSFHRGSKHYYHTPDGEYTATDRLGPWIVERRNGEEVARADTYADVLRVFAEWWNDNGYDKRERERKQW